MDDIFILHRPLIQRLYQEERKTLKEVKEILERDHQFPSLPISIYETRLRNHLGVRKKFKKSEWLVIYQHHLKTKRETSSLFLNGVKYPWVKAWKEIRRSGARQARIDGNTPLPHGVELRTPSPSPRSHSGTGSVCQYITPYSLVCSPNFRTHQASVDSKWELSSGFTKSGLSEAGTDVSEEIPVSVRQNKLSEASHTQGHLLPASIVSTQYVKLMLENLPWQNFRLIFHSTAIGAKIQREFQTINNVTYSVATRDGFSTTDLRLPLARMCDTAFPTTWHLQETITQLAVHPTNLDIYHFLAQAVYLLSNKLIYSEDSRAAKLMKGLFINLPREILSTLFQRGLPSIESVWEYLFELARKKLSSRRKNFWPHVNLNDVVCFLIYVGLQHPTWPAAGKDNLAFAAISISNSHLVQQLLNLGACPTNSRTRSYAIWRAIRVNSIPCVQALVKGCDLNFRLKDSITHFTIICTKMGRIYDRAYISAFDILLEAGADVDSQFPLIEISPRLNKGRQYSKLLEETEISKEWYPTCLDWDFQRDGELFDLMLLRSSSTDETLTRHGVLRAAMQGKSALSAYLRSRGLTWGGQVKNFLELVMREQVSKIKGWDFFNISALKTLIDFGVKIHSCDYPECCSRLLQDARCEINSETYERLHRFFQDYSSVSPEAISEAVSEKKTTLLELLSKFGVEVGDVGVHALLRAARIGNFSAVNWLLGAGVNIKAGICDDSGLGDDFTIVALLIQEIDSHRNINTKMSMLQHLVDCGAELKDRARDQYADGLFKHVLVQKTKEIHLIPGTDGDEEIITVTDKRKTADLLVPWLLKQLGVGSRKIAGAELQALSAGALKHSTGLSLIFNELHTSYGLPPDPEAVLALLIEQQAEDQLIQEVIQKSASIDIYAKMVLHDRWFTPLQAAALVCNYPLALQLLGRGADVNASPRGFFGSTALQAICLWRPMSGEERRRQQKMISLLIKSGANINAEPGPGALTAIMASADQGDIELAAVLLTHGADPNLHVTRRFERDPESTLDISARRCDMIKLFLDAGALSARRGSTGYEGAILVAEKDGNHAIAKILRGHIEQQEKQFRIHPELWSCHNAVMEKMDKQDAERCKKTCTVTIGT